MPSPVICIQITLILALKKLYGLFILMGSTASRLEPLRGGSLLFTTKFPEIPVTHFIRPRKDERLS